MPDETSLRNEREVLERLIDDSSGQTLKYCLERIEEIDALLYGVSVDDLRQIRAEAQRMANKDLNYQ